jgi:hypothetical protein
MYVKCYFSQTDQVLSDSHMALMPIKKTADRLTGGLFDKRED